MQQGMRCAFTSTSPGTAYAKRDDTRTGQDQAVLAAPVQGERDVLAPDLRQFPKFGTCNRAD